MGSAALGGSCCRYPSSPSSMQASRSSPTCPHATRPFPATATTAEQRRRRAAGPRFTAAAALAATPQPQHPLQQLWMPEKQQLWVPSRSPTPSGAAAVPGAQQALPSTGTELARVFMASAASKGRKPAMEDRHVVAALHPERGVVSARRGAVAPHAAVSVAAVFDGHSGDATASLAAQHIPRLLHAALSGSQLSSTDLAGPNLFSAGLLCPASALEAVFSRFDRWWRDARCDPSLTPYGWDDSGATAVVGLVSGQQLVVGNAGDSIALLARQGSSRRLTEEHRLGNAAEAARVREAGGRVVCTKPGGAPRVMGTSSNTRFRGSMVTRSLGDFAFKHPQPLLSAQPHVTTCGLEPSDRLVLLMSDGVSDVLPDDDLLGIGLDALQQAQSSTNDGNALAKAAAAAVMHAAYEAGSGDNITVVAMLLDWGGEFEGGSHA